MHRQTRISPISHKDDRSFRGSRIPLSDPFHMWWIGRHSWHLNSDPKSVFVSALAFHSASHGAIATAAILGLGERRRLGRQGAHRKSW